MAASSSAESAASGADSSGRTSAAAITDRITSDSAGFVSPPIATEAILVHKRQAGNPVLSHIRTAPWRYGDIGGPDYVVGRGVGIVFVSLQYHLLHPRYAFKRMRGVGREYRIKVLLILVDTSDNNAPMQELCRDAMVSQFVTLVGWSTKEAARYIETLKAMGNASAKPIMPRQEKGLRQQVTSALTAIRSINKPDIDVLASEFRTVAAMTRSPPARMQALPGLGATKAMRLLEALQAPFSAIGPEPTARERAGLPLSAITSPQYSPQAVSASRRNRQVGQAPPVATATPGDRPPAPASSAIESAAGRAAGGRAAVAPGSTAPVKRARETLKRLAAAVSAWNDSEEEDEHDEEQAGEQGSKRIAAARGTA